MSTIFIKCIIAYIFENASRNTLTHLIFLVNSPKLLSIMSNSISFSRLVFLVETDRLFVEKIFNVQECCTFKG